MTSPDPDLVRDRLREHGLEALAIVAADADGESIVLGDVKGFTLFGVAGEDGHRLVVLDVYAAEVIKNRLTEWQQSREAASALVMAEARRKVLP